MGAAVTTIRLPYVSLDKGRYYLRRRGWPRRIRLPDTLASPEFLVAYYEAIRTLEAEAKLPKRRATAGTLSWLCQQYYQSAEFKALARSSRSVRRNILERLCEIAGDVPFPLVDAKNIRRRRDALASRPESANGFLKAIRALFKWAVDAGHMGHNPATEVPRIKVKSDGFHTWSVAEVEQFMRRHGPGTKPHLALSLLLYTGVRRSDAVKLGRQMVRNGWLTLRVQKTGQELSIPILPALQEAIDLAPSGHLTFLVTEFGKPFTAAGFGNWFRARCDEAGLDRCTAHGLRKAGATLAANHGATEHALMAIYGWASPKQAAVYTKAANRRRLAEGSMGLIRLTDE